MRPVLLWAPLALFVLIVAIAIYALQSPQQREIHSRMVGQPMPNLNLPPLVPGKPGLVTRELADGKPKLVNVFASWCLPCIAEAPQLMKLKAAGVEIDAIAVRDRTDDMQAFLAQNGDPYTRIGSDPTSKAQLAMGSSGVPETFVVNGAGKIMLQHIGDIRADDVADMLKAVEAAK